MFQYVNMVPENWQLKLDIYDMEFSYFPSFWTTKKK